MNTSFPFAFPLFLSLGPRPWGCVTHIQSPSSSSLSQPGLEVRFLGDGKPGPDDKGAAPSHLPVLSDDLVPSTSIFNNKKKTERKKLYCLAGSPGVAAFLPFKECSFTLMKSGPRAPSIHAARIPQNKEKMRKPGQIIGKRRGPIDLKATREGLREAREPIVTRTHRVTKRKHVSTHVHLKPVLAHVAPPRWFQMRNSCKEKAKQKKEKLFILSLGLAGK